MQQQKLYLATILIPFILLYLVSCDPGGVKFSVHNAGEERIDSLHILVGKRNYLIEDLEPRQTKNINILIVGDVSLIVKADNYDSVIVEEKFMSHKPKGTMQLGLQKDKVVFLSSNF